MEAEKLNNENMPVAMNSPELYYAQEPVKKKEDKKGSTLKAAKNRNSVNHPKNKTYQ